MERLKYREMAKTLVAKMTVEEAASQLLHASPAISRLGVPKYNWWNEALHGVGRAGIATVFPQAIAMASTFDPDFLKKEADIISDEARAKYNAAQAEDDRDIYKGLTFWSPNINIFRDPRWGRGHETYGEDPCLTTQMGNAFIEGLQGDGEHLKTAACAKHFAVHSGPENLRHEFDAQASPKDLNETYLPAFKSAVMDKKVEAVMGAYNRVNGEPSCGSRFLLKEKLRGEWGFEGHVVSDCWAIKDFHENHHYTSRPAESASLAIRMGCDLNCGCTYENLLKGLQEGLVTEEEIRESAVRVMTTRFALGEFDESCPYHKIPYTVVGQRENREMALKAAEKSLVLLKNDGILPLDVHKLHTIAVIGPNAYSQAALYGNYHGDSDEYITNLDGIRKAVGENVRIFYSQGCHLFENNDDILCLPDRLHSETAAVVRVSDVVVLCVGLDERLEGEQGDESNKDASGDKKDLLLPKVQRRLIEKVFSLGKPVILVNNSGSAIDLSAYESRCAAIIQAWYSGQRGGEALANVLFGKTCPCGKLPVTFYYNNQPMPDFADYHMDGRTYKFVQAAPWRPFGFGLSYNTYSYKHLAVEFQQDRSVLEITVNVCNEGNMEGTEIVEVYIRYEGKTFEKPHHKLLAFKSVSLMPQETVIVDFRVNVSEMESILEDGSSILLDGSYILYIGGCQPDERSVELTGQIPLGIRVCKDGENLYTGGSASEYIYRYPDQEIYTRTEETPARFSIETPFSILYSDENTHDLLKEYLPEFMGADNPYLGQLKGVNASLQDLSKWIQGAISQEQLDLLDQKLREL